MTVASGVPAVGEAELLGYITDAKELKKGADLFNKQGMIRPARYQNKLFAEVKGSEGDLYKVSVAFADEAASLQASCTCEAAKGRPICKHAAALLVAWSRAPGSFITSDTAPPTDRVKVKEGKTAAADLMKSGIEQVETLVRELGVTGAASVGQDRVDQVQKLGESLRENKLWRLSTRTIDLAHLLRVAPDKKIAIPAARYTDLVADMLLTARKLEKHVGGEPLDLRHVEELIGKTWREADGKPVTGLRLVEVAFLSRETTDGFLIRESRFVDARSGGHYSERQIVSAREASRNVPKRSYATSVIEGAGGCIYPGFPPLRLSLADKGKDKGEERPLSPEVLEALVALALPDVGSALAALQEHRKDLFAPDLLPVSVRVDTLFARGARIEAVDAKGHALHLPDDPAVEERLANALREGRLIVLIGDVGIDAALPTIWPIAAVVEGPFGIELRTLHDAALLKKARPGAPILHAVREPSSWAAVARAAGVSAAAIILAEVREELADGFVAGLAGLNPRAMESVASRLRDLGLEKQAALAEGAARRTEAAERVSDFIKLYQVLGIALVRLAGAAYVDRETLSCVPTYESVFVRRTEAVLAPAEIRRLCSAGALNRYEAADHYARYYEELPPEELAAHIYPTWADGGTGPYVARAFAGRGPEAVFAAERALASQNARVAKMTAVRVLQTIGGDRAEGVLHRIANEDPDLALRALARDALDAIDLRRGRAEEVRARRAKADGMLTRHVKLLLTASNKEERGAAVDALVELGHRGALSALRQAYVGDTTFDVRKRAAYALALLGDTAMVDTFVKLLASRSQDQRNPEEIEVAVGALGKLGDVRGLGELLAAYAEGYCAMAIADAIKAFGLSAMEPFLDLIEEHPGIVNRKAAQNILEHLPAEELGQSLARRLAERAAGIGIGTEPDAFKERAFLFLKIADAQMKSRKIVAKAVCEHLGAPQDRGEITLLKTAERALGLR